MSQNQNKKMKLILNLHSNNISTNKILAKELQELQNLKFTFMIFKVKF